jgi:hypothetical protein
MFSSIVLGVADLSAVVRILGLTISAPPVSRDNGGKRHDNMGVARFADVVSVRRGRHLVRCSKSKARGKSSVCYEMLAPGLIQCW